MKNIYASFTDPDLAEKAVGTLLDHGVRPEHLSILFPEAYASTGEKMEPRSAEHVEDVAKSGITTTTMGDANIGAAKGAGIGFTAGAVAALASVFIPGVGLVIGGGALALALAGMAGATAAGAVAGGVTGYLKDQGVPPEETEHYYKLVQGGGALVTVSPTDENIDDAEIHSLLSKYGGSVSAFLPTPQTAVVADPLSPMTSHIGS
ncbi:MAG: hypothetical protein JSS72_11440 [Armatimonadetes bacterium]|nr:hypothetical protein [Armatimonadota bacterium]